MADLTPGLLVTPSIRLDRMLGRGGMGSVWIADHLRLKVKVVVKFVAAEHVGNTNVMFRFEREAAAAASAKGPHVVQILDYGMSDMGIPYIAMELLEGEDLGKKLAREGRIHPHQWAEILRQTCRGLTRAHAQGIVHRDIKPENIFLTVQDEELLVKVLDFGIAKSHDRSAGFSSTKTGAFIGTAYYMSPEQTLGHRNIDHRTDLWSLGVVTYLALTGVRPFDGDVIGALVIAITSLPIVPMSQHVPSLGPALDTWMATALARDPHARFGSAKDMAASFEAAVRHLGPWTAAPAVTIHEAVGSVGPTTAADPHPIVALQPATHTTGSGALIHSVVTTRSRTGAPRRWALIAAVGIAAIALAGVWIFSKDAKRSAVTPKETAIAAEAMPMSASASATALAIEVTQAPPSLALTAAPEAGLVLEVFGAPSTQLPTAPSGVATSKRGAPHTAKAPPAVGATSPRLGAPSCHVVSYFDGEGNKRFKQECP